MSPHIPSIFSSLAYKYLERCFVQGISFVVGIILARLLAPEDFGLLALMMIFISVASTFVHGGFNTALIQSKDATDEDFSSIFWLTLSVASIAYTILFFAAPYIAVFYSMPHITPIFRVMGITLFFGAMNSIQVARLSRSMNFKKQMQASMGAVLISGTTGIAMAYNDAGLWALVTQQLVNRIALCSIMLITVDWRPRFVFSLAKVKKLFSFGWKLLISGLLDTLYRELHALIIGKIYSPAALGFYARGQHFPSFIIDNINSSIQAVLLPVLSSYQDDKATAKALMRRGIMTSSFIIFPMMAGLASVAEPLVRLLLTDKWLPAVPFLQIYCFIYALWPIHTANLQAINAMGRSDIFLKLEVIKKVTGLTILGVTIWQFNSPIAIAFSAMLGGTISSFINAYPNKKLLQYSYKEQLQDLIPSFLLSLVMAICIYPLTFLQLHSSIIMLLQILSGIIIYTTLAYICKIEVFTYLLDKVLPVIKRKRGIPS